LFHFEWIDETNNCLSNFFFKTIEESFMKHSKSHGGAGGGSAGLSDLLSNYDAYQRWVRGAHERVQFVKGALAVIVSSFQEINVEDY
jgi:hypothetical protein